MLAHSFSLVVLFVAGVTSLREPGPLSPRIASYRIAVKLDPQHHSLSATESLFWRNDGGAPTHELFFHLYLNAFKNDGTAMLAAPEHGLPRRGQPSGHYGAIDVQNLRCAGAPLVLELLEDGTVARARLPRPVAPGETLRCELGFTATLPEIVARAGYAGEFHMVTQWFPKLGVWDGRSWQCHVYCASCEFFSDFGVYEVAITVPERFVVGASGALVRTSRAAGERTEHYLAEDVHDFAWAAAAAFREITETMDARAGVGPVRVRLLYQPEHAWFATEQMRMLRATLRDYGDWFGRYPYATLTAIDPPDDATDAAMEYPTLVGIESPPGRLGPADYARYVTIHELGHNWFYGLLASNEAEEPWLDEGLNEYVSDVVLERAAPRGILARLGLSQLFLERQGWLGAGLSGVGFGRPARDFPSRPAYEGAVYSQTATLLASLARRYGFERLVGALGTYARRFRFRHPRAEDLVGVLAETLGPEVVPLVRQSAAGEVWDDEVARVDAMRLPERPGAPWRSQVVVHRKGTHVHPVEVRVRFDDGSEVRERWDGRARWQRFVYERPRPVTEAVVDPDGAWLIDTDLSNNGLARTPQRAPAVRMAEGLGFWLQSLWQILAL